MCGQCRQASLAAASTLAAGHVSSIYGVQAAAAMVPGKATAPCGALGALVILIGDGWRFPVFVIVTDAGIITALPGEPVQFGIWSEVPS